MPYNKKGVLERYQKVPFAPGKTVAQVASKALYVASKVAKALNVEKKYHDSYTGANLAAPLIIPLNIIQQGDTGQSRDGDQVKMTFINGRIAINNETPGAHNVRFMVIHDRQSDGNTPDFGEILELQGGSIVGTNALNNLDNKFRFHTLYDKTVSLPGQVDGGTPELTVGANSLRQFVIALNLYKKYKKGTGLRVRYSASTGAISDIASNAVYLLVLPDSGQAEIHCTINMRVRFVDN